MELLDFACPEPIVIQLIELPFCSQMNEGTDAEMIRDSSDTSTGDAYSVMLDHACMLMLLCRSQV